VVIHKAGGVADAQRIEGRPQVGDSLPDTDTMTPEDYRDAKARLGLSNRQMATKLGLSRNAANAYANGTSRIPLYIGLACAALLVGLPPHTRARQSRVRRSTEPLDLSQTDSAVDPSTDTPITV
jgi:hypothetical protein